VYCINGYHARHAVFTDFSNVKIASYFAAKKLSRSKRDAEGMLFFNDETELLPNISRCIALASS
jgi:hypothetical protein